MIRLENVTKQSANAPAPALQNVHLTIEQGEFVFLVGASGSGKSSLLRLLVKEEVATEGTVTVDGVDVGQIPSRKVPAYRRQMGIVFQDFRLLPNRTVYENVAFGMRIVQLERGHIVRDQERGIYGHTGH